MILIFRIKENTGYCYPVNPILFYYKELLNPYSMDSILFRFLKSIEFIINIDKQK